MRRQSREALKKELREVEIKKIRDKNPRAIVPEDRYRMDRVASAVYFGAELGWSPVGKEVAARLEEARRVLEKKKKVRGGEGDC